MRRATIILSDDLEAAIADYRQRQADVPSLTDVVEAALREYLAGRSFLSPSRPLVITPSVPGSGKTDVSIEHDRYFAEE